VAHKVMEGRIKLLSDFRAFDAMHTGFVSWNNLSIYVYDGSRGVLCIQPVPAGSMCYACDVR
jgi:hypothetical protein